VNVQLVEHSLRTLNGPFNWNIIHKSEVSSMWLLLVVVNSAFRVLRIVESTRIIGWDVPPNRRTLDRGYQPPAAPTLTCHRLPRRLYDLRPLGCGKFLEANCDTNINTNWSFRARNEGLYQTWVGCRRPNLPSGKPSFMGHLYSRQNLSIVYPPHWLVKQHTFQITPTLLLWDSFIHVSISSLDDFLPKDCHIGQEHSRTLD